MDKIAAVEEVLIGLSHLTAIFSAAFTLCTSELSVTFSSSLLEFFGQFKRPQIKPEGARETSCERV